MMNEDDPVVLDYDNLVADLGEAIRERDEARSHLAMFESMAVEAIKDHDRVKVERDALWKATQDRDKEIAQVSRELHTMRDMLLECAAELEAEIEGTYEGVKHHPVMQRKYERDMEVVHRARSLVEQGVEK